MTTVIASANSVAAVQIANCHGLMRLRAERSFSMSHVGFCLRGINRSHGAAPVAGAATKGTAARTGHHPLAKMECQASRRRCGYCRDCYAKLYGAFA